MRWDTLGEVKARVDCWQDVLVMGAGPCDPGAGVTYGAAVLRGLGEINPWFLPGAFLETV